MNIIVRRASSQSVSEYTNESQQILAQNLNWVNFIQLRMDVMSLRTLCRQNWNVWAVANSLENMCATTKGLHVEARYNVTSIL